MKAEEDDAILREEWESRTDVGEVRMPLADQVRDTHRVEDARVRRLRCRQIGVAVEVDQPEVSLMAQEAGHDAECDGAIAAEHDRDQLALDRSGDALRDLVRNLDDPRLALPLAVAAIRGKASNRENTDRLQFEARF